MTASWQLFSTESHGSEERLTLPLQGKSPVLYQHSLQGPSSRQGPGDRAHEMDFIKMPSPPETLPEATEEEFLARIELDVAVAKDRALYSAIKAIWPRPPLAYNAG